MKLIKKEKIKPYDVMWDITTKNNHNFLVENVVVHNSNAGYCLDTEGFHVCSRNMSLEQDENNLYWKIALEYNIEEKLRNIKSEYPDASAVWIHGEIFGKGVQDLHYGLSKPEFRAFDIRIDNTFLSYDPFLALAKNIDLPVVPTAYKGPFVSLDHCKELAECDEPMSGEARHINEGVVIRPINEIVDYRGNRIIGKCVSDAYLFRKNGTEYH